MGQGPALLSQGMGALGESDVARLPSPNSLDTSTDQGSFMRNRISIGKTWLGSNLVMWQTIAEVIIDFTVTPLSHDFPF